MHTICELSLFISLKRRALAPLAWLTRLAARRRGRAGRAAARPGPVHIPSSSAAGRVLFAFPQAPGARSACLAYAPCGAPARSRRPGRCAARSRSHPRLVGRRAGFVCFPSGAGRSLRSLGLRAWRRAGAVAPAGPLRGPVHPVSHIAWLQGGGHPAPWRDGAVPGVTSSANFGHTIGKPIAMGYVPAAEARQRDCEIEAFSRPIPTLRHDEPLYDPEGTRQPA